MLLVLGKVDICPLQEALLNLEAAIVEAKSLLEIAGTIQYFEHSYELTWKTLHKTLIASGKNVFKNPRIVFREAAAAGLLEDPEQWFKFIDWRNETSHAYDEEVARRIFAMLPLFRDHVREVIRILEALQQ
ncbi:MAG: HI0074 family nucleotidyltransferase substrate-binding subunit [Alphaproteobacteria bacterium]